MRFFLKVQVPEDYHTLYWCQIFSLPAWSKHHVIKFEPIIQKGNEMVVHHMLLYGCADKDMSTYVDKGEACFDRNGTTFNPMMQCTENYIAGWAVGASVSSCNKHK